MTESLTKAVQELSERFTAFQKANDEAVKQIATKGHVDALLQAKIESLNKAIDAAEEKIAKRVDGVERRIQLTHGDARLPGRDVAAEAIAFGILTKQPVSVEQVQKYEKAFGEYLRRGEKALSSAVLADLAIGSDPSGGYHVRPDMSGRIVTKEFETSPMRQIASTQTISTDKLSGPVDRDEADAGWVGDEESRESTTDTPEVGEWEIPVHEQYAQPIARQTLLDDAAVDVEGWLVGKIADKLSRVENAAFVTGNGVKKPRGFLDYSTVTTDDDSRAWGVLQHVVTGAAATFASTNPGDVLIKLEGELKPKYLANARYAMRRSVRSLVRQFKDGNGNYLWQPDFTKGGPGTLCGYPIEILADMPAVAANALVVAFGDFKAAYQIVDRAGITLLRDPYTKKGWVKFYVTKRTGGAVIDFDALKLAKCST